MSAPISDKLQAARDHEARFAASAEAADRPAFHLTPLVGWMNDPNGFSFYQGRYHLFYQYYPFATNNVELYWGHAVSDDLLHWEYLPCALAPDSPADAAGVFSGSAVTADDGRQLLMYTGVINKGWQDDGRPHYAQVQCVAFGDGRDYEKYEGNPVIDGSQVPEGSSAENFRDPKVWREADGSYRAVVGNHDAEGDGQALLFASDDALSWRLERVLAKNNGRFGEMWECPDFFELDGHAVLLLNPLHMLATGHEYYDGHGTVALIGHLDESGAFVEEADQATESGVDFYATQTTLAPDGRRIMVAWMQNWATRAVNDDKPWFGQMTIPRELSIRDGRLCQWPIRELDALRRDPVRHEGVAFEGIASLDGVEGRCVDLNLTIRAENPAAGYEEFSVWFAQDGPLHSSLSYRPKEGVLRMSRSRSGSRRAALHSRKCELIPADGVLRLRVVLDRYSAEVFVGEGEKAMSLVIPTDPSAEAITFLSRGRVVIDVEKYELRA